MAGALLLILGLAVVIGRRRKLNRARDVALNRDRAPRPNDRQPSGTGLAPYNAAVSNPTFNPTYDIVQQMEATDQNGMSNSANAYETPLSASSEYDSVVHMKNIPAQNGDEQMYEAIDYIDVDQDEPDHMYEALGPGVADEKFGFQSSQDDTDDMYEALGPGDTAEGQLSDEAGTHQVAIYDVAAASTMVMSQGDVIYESAA